MTAQEQQVALQAEIAALIEKGHALGMTTKEIRTGVTKADRTAAKIPHAVVLHQANGAGTITLLIARSQRIAAAYKGNLLKQNNGANLNVTLDPRKGHTFAARGKAKQEQDSKAAGNTVA